MNASINPIATALFSMCSAMAGASDPVRRTHALEAPRLPANMWAADLEGYQPTADDQAYWADNLAPEAELAPLLDSTATPIRDPF